ncbi:MAG: transporter [Rikenellaceae bacterium]
MNQYTKSILMLAAMSLGAIFSKSVTFVDSLASGMIAPALLFAMLFITFCCVDLRDLKFSMMHVWIVVFQLITAITSFYLLLPFGHIFAQGVMVCFIAPVAMAAVVVGRLLGAKVLTIATFTIVCNVVMAIFIPLFFIHIGSEGCSFAMILRRVAPLLIAPPILAQLIRYTIPSITSWFGQRGYLSYYIWLVSLVVTVGRTVNFVVNNINSIELLLAIALALGSLATCLIQYRVGRLIGCRYGDPAAGEQSLGQKNTILAIWMTQTFLSPVASIAPTAYVIWQNLMNSYKIYRVEKGKNN